MSVQTPMGVAVVSATEKLVALIQDYDIPVSVGEIAKLAMALAVHYHFEHEFYHESGAAAIKLTLRPTDRTASVQINGVTNTDLTAKATMFYRIVEKV